jgi:hypothetical protein
MHAQIVIQEIANGFLVSTDTILGGRETTATYFRNEEELQEVAAAIVADALKSAREARAEMEHQRTIQQNYALNRRELMGSQDTSGQVVGRFNA